MNDFSPRVGLLKTEEYVRYFEFSLKQLNINYEIIDSISSKCDFYISSRDKNIDIFSIKENNLLSGFVVTLARSKQGQIVVYPVSSFQENEVITPAENLSDSLASKLQSVAIDLATKNNLEGSLEVVFSKEKNEVCQVNSSPTFLSLWTIDGAITSIFENHLRGLLNLPLGSPKLLNQTVVTIQVIGGNYSDMYKPFLHILARDPELRVHLYQKKVILNEVVGHVTLKGKNVKDLLERAHHAADYLNGKITE